MDGPDPPRKSTRVSGVKTYGKTCMITAREWCELLHHEMGQELFSVDAIASEAKGQIAADCVVVSRALHSLHSEGTQGIGEHER